MADGSGLYINAPERIMIKCGESFIEMKPHKMTIGCWGGEVVVYNFVKAGV